MELQSFLIATLFAHAGFTIFVTGHAVATGRDIGKWPLVTLVFGLAGLAAYFFYDETPESERI